MFEELKKEISVIRVHCNFSKCFWRPDAPCDSGKLCNLPKSWHVLFRPPLLPCPALALPYTSPRVTLYSLVVVVVVIVVAGFGFWAKALVSLAALVQCVHLNWPLVQVKLLIAFSQLTIINCFWHFSTESQSEQRQRKRVRKTDKMSWKLECIRRRCNHHVGQQIGVAKGRRKRGAGESDWESIQMLITLTRWLVIAFFAVNRFCCSCWLCKFVPHVVCINIFMWNF